MTTENAQPCPICKSPSTNDPMVGCDRCQGKTTPVLRVVPPIHQPAALQKEIYDSGAIRDRRSGKGRYDLLSPFALRRLAHTLEKGGVHNGDRNWELGMPLCRFLDSAMRHLQQWLMRQDDTDDDHLSQAAWNVLALLHFDSLGRTDLDDRPVWQKEGAS